jgi:hypothetical protein
MVVYCTKASKWTSVQFALNKENHSAQHLKTPEPPPLQNLPITFAKKDAIYSASLLGGCSLPPLHLKSN